MFPTVLFIVHLFLQAKSDGSCGSIASDSRIVGGQDTGGYLYPWFAVLRLRTAGDPVVCAGSLIAPSYILTAAHCFTIFPNKPKESLFTVALGVYNRCAATEPSRQIFSVTHVDVHESYPSSNKFFDIAVMKLDRSSDFPVVCLPAPGGLANSEPGLLVGFGVTRQGNRDLPCRQRQATVTKYSSKQCEDSRLPYEDSHEPTVFCAGAPGVDSCQGDSGGPFLTKNSDGRYVVAGIVSFGYGCAKNGLPGIYTNVASYLDWISSKISQDQKNQISINNQFKNNSIQANPMGDVRISIFPTRFTEINKNKNELNLKFPGINNPQREPSVYIPPQIRQNNKNKNELSIIFPGNNIPQSKPLQYIPTTNNNYQIKFPNS